MKITIGKLFTITVCSLFFAELGGFFYVRLTHSVPTNWGTVGLWFTRVLQGHWISSANTLLCPTQLDTHIGLIVHCIVALVFTLFYLYFLTNLLQSRASYINGILFGLILLIFPFFFQLPSMGEGFFGLHAPHFLNVFFRVITYHISFGFGLGFGGVLFDYLRQRYDL